MKHLVLFLSIILMASCGGYSRKSTDSKQKKESVSRSASHGGNVFICTGGSSERYHSDRECKGLSRCSGEIEEISEEEAEDMGRTPCKICY